MQAVAASDPPVSRRSEHTATWLLRLAWLTLPVTLGPALADGLHDTGGGLRTTASVGLWVLWALGLLATLVPRPASLTAVRLCGPAAAAAAVWASQATDDTTWAVVGLGAGLLAAATALSAPVGDMFVDGASYGDERRFLLKAPGPVVMLLGPVAWAVVVAGTLTGPLLLADGNRGIGGVASAVGLPLAAGAVRALHQLGRRWVVLVPAGFVLHDHLALAEPTLVQRSGMASVGPARSDTDALDLSQGAPGLAIELRCTGPHDLLPATRRGVTEAIAVDAFLCTPVRPDALLAEAARRNLPVG